MKRIIIIMAMSLSSLALFSQEIGVRLGDIVGNHIAIDAVFGGAKYRQHVNVSFGDGIGVEWLADFHVAPLSGEYLDYYIGAGGFVWLGDPTSFGVCGELGAEYHFNTAPLAIGIDWRPTIPLYNSKSGFIGSRFGLNIRYVF